MGKPKRKAAHRQRVIWVLMVLIVTVVMLSGVMMLLLSCDGCLGPSSYTRNAELTATLIVATNQAIIRNRTETTNWLDKATFDPTMAEFVGGAQTEQAKQATEVAATEAAQ